MTPPDVVQAIDVIARHLRERHYSCAIINSRSGAIFRMGDVIDELMDAYADVGRLVKRERKRKARKETTG